MARKGNNVHRNKHRAITARRAGMLTIEGTDVQHRLGFSDNHRNVWTAEGKERYEDRKARKQAAGFSGDMAAYAARCEANKVAAATAATRAEEARKLRAERAEMARKLRG